MPTKLALSWIPALKRWRKRYKGKTYYFVFGTGKTDRAGYQLALAAWEKKKTELDSDPPTEIPANYRRLIEKHEMMRDWFIAQGETEQATKHRARIDDLCRDARLPVPPKLSSWDDPLQNISEAGRWVWQDRFETLKQNRAAVNSDRTIKAYVTSFLKRKEMQAEMQECSAAWYGVVKAHLTHFASWIGNESAPSSINSKTLMDFHTWLLEQVRSEAFSRDYAKNILVTVKRFIRHLWELDACELPRNIDNKDLSISTGHKKIVTFSVDEIGQLLNGAEGKTLLYLFLQLNCGFTQKDIGDLLQSEVNLKSGRITRRRSKERNKLDEEGAEDEESTVPVVSYKLWPETLALLKTHRSKHPTLFLVNENNLPLYRTWIADGVHRKVDNIRTAYQHLTKRLKIPSPKPMKLMRKTSATLLKSNESYRGIYQYFLGHAPPSIADRHYAAESESLFDKSLNWLRSELKVADLACNATPLDKRSDGTARTNKPGQRSRKQHANPKADVKKAVSKPRRLPPEG